MNSWGNAPRLSVRCWLGAVAARACAVAVSILLGLAGPAWADEVVILQGAPLQPISEAIQGFKRAIEASAAHRGPRRVEPVVFREISSVGRDQGPAIVRSVRALKPDLVLAAGPLPLAALQELKEIPIVYILVHSPPGWVQRRSNVTGVDMTIPADRCLERVRASLPDRKRLGLLYDPKTMGAFVGEAKAAAARQGLSLVVREVSSPREVHERLAELKGLIDAFWMLPDPTVVTPQSMDSLRLFSLRNRVPIISFSEQYLDQGATLAVVPDFGSMGRQAGEMARRLLDGEDVHLAPPEAPREILVRVNGTVAEKLGVALTTTKRGRDD